jgi:hypothetical protein
MTKRTVTFPPKPQEPAASLSREHVIDYLLRLSALGQVVHSDGDDYVLPIEAGEARIASVGELWRISHTRHRVLSTYGDASTEAELDKLLRMTFGSPRSWPAPPQKGRLSADKPASNFRTVASLIGSGEIQAVFDTYLDNEGLEALIRILSFGNGRVADQVRLLGTTATTTGGTGKPPRFTKAGVHAWSVQLGIQAEAKALSQRSEHRRFMLLDGHRSLILGPSLNSLHKNEALAVEDDTEDRPFFDKQWLIAAPLK